MPDTKPPAADAGPRQPELGVCDYEPTFPHENKWHSHSNNAWGQITHFDCRNWRPDAPPVPQEAAPCPTCGALGQYHKFIFHHRPSSAPARKLALSEIPGSLLNDGITEVEVAANRAGLSDASGLAERKIRQRFSQHGDLARIDDILAALIREAGSEREREFTRRLQISLADIDTLLGIAGSTVNSTVLAMIKLSQAEASRLLGGESNG